MGLPNADELLFKADLVIAITKVIERHGWTQSQAAKRAGLDQPKISALLSGALTGFSVDRLLKILTRFGQDVEIRVLDSKTAVGSVNVAA
jgi:predicted XRE-type DNA-binding protein